MTNDAHKITLSETLDAGIALGRADVVQAIRQWIAARDSAARLADVPLSFTVVEILGAIQGLVDHYAAEATAASVKRHAGKTREQMIAEIEAKEALARPLLPNAASIPDDDAAMSAKIAPRGTP